MAIKTVVAHWKVGNTRPAVLITLDLGLDPVSGDPRTLVTGDVITQIMRPPSGPAIVRVLTITGPLTNNQVTYDPTTGDFAVAGTYEVEFDLTDSGAQVETIPDDSDNNYGYKISAKVPLA